jgi:adenylate kinase family enzyme
MTLERIVIVGKPGAGKTTLAAQLASRLSLRNIELDGISWQANWVQLPKNDMRERVSEAITVTGDWVLDGNYHSVHDIVWARADTLIWLDYPLRVAPTATPAADNGPNLSTKRALEWESGISSTLFEAESR